MANWNPGSEALVVQSSSSQAKAVEPTIKCSKCSSLWFERVEVNQYLDRTVILGQELAKNLAMPSWMLLRCIRCNEVHEPRLLLSTYDSIRKEYDKFRAGMGSAGKMVPQTPFASQDGQNKSS